MADLFLSCSSQGRLRAERLFNELRLRFPTLAPRQQTVSPTRYQSLRSAAGEVLEDYVLSQIPASGTIAPCGVDIPHPGKIERLLRGSLGAFYRERAMMRTKGLVSSAP